MEVSGPLMWNHPDDGRSAAREPIPCQSVVRHSRRAGSVRWLRLVCLLASLTILAPTAPAVGGGARDLQERPPSAAADTLIRADALVRSGHLSQARVLLDQVIDRFPGTAWA